MPVTVLTGGPGALGITTTVLGLMFCWPSDMMLPDCDRDPVQAIPVSYLRGPDLGDKELTALARLHCETQDVGLELPRQVIALTKGDTTSRRFLPGFAQPGAVWLFDYIWPGFAGASVGLGSQGVDVTVDAGRLGRDDLPAASLEIVSIVGLVLQNDLRPLAISCLCLPLLAEQANTLPANRPLGLVPVGPDHPYPMHETIAQFRIDCRVRIPRDPKPAGVLNHGLAPFRRFNNPPLLGPHRVVALYLTQRLERVRTLRHELL